MLSTPFYWWYCTCGEHGANCEVRCLRICKLQAADASLTAANPGLCFAEKHRVCGAGIMTNCDICDFSGLLPREDRSIYLQARRQGKTSWSVRKIAGHHTSRLDLYPKPSSKSKVKTISEKDILRKRLNIERGKMGSHTHSMNYYAVYCPIVLIISAFSAIHHLGSGKERKVLKAC